MEFGDNNANGDGTASAYIHVEDDSTLKVGRYFRLGNNDSNPANGESIMYLSGTSETTLGDLWTDKMEAMDYIEISDAAILVVSKIDEAGGDQTAAVNALVNSGIIRSGSPGKGVDSSYSVGDDETTISLCTAPAGDLDGDCDVDLADPCSNGWLMAPMMYAG